MFFYFQDPEFPEWFWVDGDSAEVNKGVDGIVYTVSARNLQHLLVKAFIPNVLDFQNPQMPLWAAEVPGQWRQLMAQQSLMKQPKPKTPLPTEHKALAVLLTLSGLSEDKIKSIINFNFFKEPA